MSYESFARVIQKHEPQSSVGWIQKHHSATLLDHIFIKSPKKLIQNKCSSGNLITDISDHLSNFSIINIKTQSIKDRPDVRLFSQRNTDRYNENIASEPPLINQSEMIEANHSYDTFSKNCLEIFNKYFICTSENTTLYIQCKWNTHTKCCYNSVSKCKILVVNNRIHSILDVRLSFLLIH